jgi:hypothetical protein
MQGEQSKLQLEGVMADVCLGKTVAGLYTLVEWASFSRSCDARD